MRTYLAAAATALALQFSPAHADSIVALVGSDVLATIDTTGAKITSLAKLEGAGTLLGLDVRPADGQLYGLASDGTVYTIDLASGVATVKVKLDTALPENVDVSVDFNPVADRMRIIGTDGTNLRANVDDGKVTKDQPLKFADGDAAVGQTPTVIAAGYTNAVKGAKETTLYDIDGAQGVLVRQAPPNDGILNSIGSLGLDAPSVGFDISTDASGANIAMLVAKGNLYSVDLTSGKVVGGKKVTGLPNDVRDIAVLPAAMKRTADINGMVVKAQGGTTAGYLPDTMTGASKPMTPMKTGMTMKGGETKTSAAMAPARKAKRTLSCNRDMKAQY